MIFESIGQFMSKLMFFHGFVEAHGSYPHPLNREQEAKYIEAMQNGDLSARERLINHNLRLVAHVAKKYSQAAEADDLISVGSIGLIKAIDSYKAGKGTQLSTYASRCIENEILMLLRSNKKHKPVLSIEESIGTDKDGNDLSLKDTIPQKEEDDPDKVVIKRVYLEQIKEEMAKNLDDREYQVLNLRYGLSDGLERTQQEVARQLNISRSYISRIENKAIGMLREIFVDYNLDP